MLDSLPLATAGPAHHRARLKGAIITASIVESAQRACPSLEEEGTTTAVVVQRWLRRNISLAFPVDVEGSLREHG